MTHQLTIAYTGHVWVTEAATRHAAILHTVCEMPHLPPEVDASIQKALVVWKDNNDQDMILVLSPCPTSLKG